MNKVCKQVAVASSLLVLLCASAGARAQNGVIGSAINGVLPGVGTALDQANHDLGHPFEKGVAEGLDTVVPGAGGVFQAGVQVQRSGILDGGAAPRPPAMPMVPPPVFGNACMTPVGVYFGPMNPLGTPCVANTPYGPALGSVGR